MAFLLTQPALRPRDWYSSTMLCIIDIKGVTKITMEELVLLNVLNTSGRRAKQRLLPYPVGKITKQSFPFKKCKTTFSCSGLIESYPRCFPACLIISYIHLTKSTRP